MKRFKAHIAIFLMLGFLFPQGAVSMHSFLVPHHAYDASQFTIKTLNDFEYHSCIYHLNGFSPHILSKENVDKPSRFKTPVTTVKFCCLENYVHQPDFNFQLRGPPLNKKFSH